MTRIFALALAGLCVTAAPALAQEDKRLNSREIQAALTGTTATLDGTMAEYHAEDGVAIIRDREDGKTVIRVGTWKAKRDTVCYKYVDQPGEEYCWRVFRMADGATILWGTENQIIIEVNLAKGDTTNLERRISPELRAQAAALR